MIKVEEALKIILRTTPCALKETLPLEKANARILANDIYATRDQPPFHRVAMDGIAINTKSINTKFEPHYTIEGIQAAGQEKMTLKELNNCIEVMTGAVLPNNCDCVIPYENITIENQIAIIEAKDIIEMKNIHKMGSDYNKGELLLKEGTKINSAVCAILASQGTRDISVYRMPTMTIISTGSELIELDQVIKEHQIFMSNSYAIENELLNFGIHQVIRKHIVDDREKTELVIKTSLEDSDILILTGGVSKGKYDFIPESLKNLGVEKQFHKIEQKPGKPMFYGTKGSKQIFALPGNPVSCLVCLRRYVIPSIEARLKRIPKLIYGILQNEIIFKSSFVYFPCVKTVSTINGELNLIPIESNGSGDFNSISQSDGFIQLPGDKQRFLPGEIYPFFPWNF